MIDQATQLRNMAQAAGRQQRMPGQAPRVAVILGGKGGVGATTLAVNVAAGAAGRGRRVALIEAEADRADIAPLCGLPDGHALDQVLRSQRTLQETLQDAGEGLKIAGGTWASEACDDYGPAARQRLLSQIQSLGGETDLVLLDTANGGSSLTSQLWESCDEAVVVTTPDDLSVMDSYAAIKRLGNRPSLLSLVVNRCQGSDEAANVFRRIDRSCRRFLGFELTLAGHVPVDPLVTEAGAHRVPLVRLWPESPAGQAMIDLASALQQRCPSPPQETRAA